MKHRLSLSSGNVHSYLNLWLTHGFYPTFGVYKFQELQLCQVYPPLQWLMPPATGMAEVRSGAEMLSNHGGLLYRHGYDKMKNFIKP